MMIRPIGSLNIATANNAAFDYMNSCNSLMAISKCPSGKSSVQFEKNLNAQMLNDNLIYKASLLQADSMKRAKEQNMKRALDIFA